MEQRQMDLQSIEPNRDDWPKARSKNLSSSKRSYSAPDRMHL